MRCTGEADGGNDLVIWQVHDGQHPNITSQKRVQQPIRVCLLLQDSPPNKKKAGFLVGSP